MSLRIKTLAVICLTALACMGGVYLISHHILLDNFESIEVQRTKKISMQVSKNLDYELDTLGLITQLINTSLREEPQLSNNLYSLKDKLERTQLSHVDLITIADVSTKKQSFTYISKNIAQPPFDITQFQRSLSQLPDNSQGILVVNGQVWLIVQYREPNSNRGMQPKIVAARHLNNALLDEIGRTIGATINVQTVIDAKDLGFFSIPHPNKDSQQHPKTLKSSITDKGVEISWPEPELIRGSITFEDTLGRPVLTLRIDNQPSIMLSGRESVMLFMFVMAIASGGVLCIGTLLHEALLLSRLMNLILEVRVMVRSNNIIDQRVTVSGNDELTELTEAINGILSCMEDQHRQLKDSEQELSELIEAIPDLVCFKDADGRWRRVNRNGLRILGLDSIDVLGKTDIEFNSRINSNYKQSKNASKSLSLYESKNKTKFEVSIRNGECDRWLEVFNIPLFHNTSGEYKGMVMLGRDITDRKLYQNASLFQRVFNSSSDGIIITDANQFIVLVNEAFHRITGYCLEECIGQSPAILHSGKQDEVFYEKMWLSIKETDHWAGEVYNRRKNGEIYPQHLTLDVVRNENDCIINYVAIFSDISEQKETEFLIEQQANYDSLTGLANRNLLRERINQALLAGQRHQSKAALIFIDLDRFKAINDSLGHAYGDLLLKNVAQRLQDCVRQVDTIARWGGDEFVALLVDISHLEGIDRVCSLVLEQLNTPFDLDGHEVQISGSLGIAVYPDDAETTDEMLKRADTAMYRAKESGRANFCYFSLEMEEQAQSRGLLEQELRSALSKKQFCLHYQPVINIATGQLCGIEALVRWNHPINGFISPETFIPIAEENGFIRELGEWVLWEACRDIVSLKSQFPANAYLAVNVSARQWRLQNMHNLVMEVLETTGLPARQLILEVTEQSFLDDIDFVAEVLNDLKKIGVRSLLDDFGTGYSSLSYLKRLPVHGLKIDRSFVSDIDTNQENTTLIKAILAITNNMNLTVVAEGVETTGQHNWLINEGVYIAQGYLFSKPIPLPELINFLKSENKFIRTKENTQLQIADECIN